jgi:hypothetical protein
MVPQLGKSSSGLPRLFLALHHLEMRIITMTAVLEKGGGTFSGIKLLLCENPLPPLEEAIVAAQAEAPRSNYYTEPYSAPLMPPFERADGGTGTIDLTQLEIPPQTTLAVIVNPNELLPGTMSGPPVIKPRNLIVAE